MAGLPGEENGTERGSGCADAAPGSFASSYRELRVYQLAFELAMELHALSSSFPASERFALCDQIRRSSRSVCSNLAEAWRKRRYKNAFVAKLSDAETEACETQVWIQFAQACGYLSKEKADSLESSYEQTLASIVAMARDADRWLIQQ